MLGCRKTLTLTVLFLLFLASPVFAEVRITEVMYDLEGTDAGGEWVELYNDGGQAVTIIGGTTGTNSWRVYEQSKTGTEYNRTFLKEAYQGDMTLASHEYAVVAEDGLIFKNNNSSYGGKILISSAMSLANDAMKIGLRLGSQGVPWSLVDYTSDMGAKGDGNSLQWNGSSWIAAAPTPGAVNATIDTNTSNSTTDSDTAEETTPTAGNIGVIGSGDALGPVTSRDITRLDITRDKNRIIVNDEITFSAKAYAGDLRFPAEAKYEWNFGDGTTAVGAIVNHAYHYTGTYVVSVSAKSVLGQVTKTQTISALGAPVLIALTSGVPTPAIRLSNTVAENVDVSAWKITDGAKVFILPPQTVIAPNGTITLDEQILGFVPDESSQLFFKNGSLAAAVSRGGQSTMSSKAPVATPVRGVSASMATVGSKATPSTSGTTVSTQTPSNDIQNQSVAATILAEPENASGGSMSPWLLALAAILGLSMVVLAYRSFKGPKQGFQRVLGLNRKALEADSFEIIEDADT